jgi:hypothetical protein
MAQATAVKPTGRAHRIAKDVKPEATDSTIAKLDQHTTPEAANAPAKAGLKTGKAYTGQGLYDRLIVNDKADKTNMELIRDILGKVDTASFKTLLKDFVGVAKGYLDNAEKAEPYDQTAHLTAQARYKTAQNYQTRMRVIYGALKFASDQMDELGYTESTGWIAAYEMGGKALANAGFKWDGSKAEAPEVKAARLEKKAEADAIAEVMATMPKRDNESRADYLLRVDEAVDNVRKQQAEETKAKQVKAIADKVRAMAGSYLSEVIDMIEHDQAAVEQPALH